MRTALRLGGVAALLALFAWFALDDEHDARVVTPSPADETRVTTRDSVPPETPAPRSRASLSGTVRAGGRPVEGAVVKVIGGIGANPVRTGADGRYFVEGPVARMRGMVFVEHPSYAAVRREGVEFAAGRETVLDFELELAVFIEGRVLDYEGNPAAGCELRVVERVDDHFESMGHVHADASGRFRTRALRVEPARKRVVARHKTNGRVELSSVEVEAQGPGVVDAGVLQPIETLLDVVIENPRPDETYRFTSSPDDSFEFDTPSVKIAGLPAGRLRWDVDGDRRDAEGEFDFTGVGELRVVLRDLPPRPANGRLTVWVDVGHEERAHVLVADAEGRVTASDPPAGRRSVAFELPAGRYRVVVGTAERTGAEEVEILADGAREVAVRPTAAARVVTITVRREGAPVPGATVRVTGLSEQRGPLFGGLVLATAGDDGVAVLRGVPAGGTLRFSVLDPQGKGRGATAGPDQDAVVVDLP